MTTFRIRTAEQTRSSGPPQQIRSSLRSSDFVNVFPGRHTRWKLKIDGCPIVSVRPRRFLILGFRSDPLLPTARRGEPSTMLNSSKQEIRPRCVHSSLSGATVFFVALNTGALCQNFSHHASFVAADGCGTRRDRSDHHIVDSIHSA